VMGLEIDFEESAEVRGFTFSPSGVSNYELPFLISLYAQISRANRNESYLQEYR
jgi:hypothetical protein